MFTIDAPRIASLWIDTHMQLGMLSFSTDTTNNDATKDESV